MPTPWGPHVQKSGRLTVFPAEKMLSAAAWGQTLFERILLEFNNLCQANTLGVRMIPDYKNEPQQNGLGADIRFDVTAGPCPIFNAAGKDEMGSLDTRPGHVRGVCFKPVAYWGPGAKFDYVFKALVFLPVNPLVDNRTAGVHVRIATALHELFHACGLNEDDPGHGTEQIPAQGELDLYATGGVVLPGTNPGGDQLLIGGRSVPGPGGRYTITPRTASLVQSIWLLGRL